MKAISQIILVTLFNLLVVEVLVLSSSWASGAESSVVSLPESTPSAVPQPSAGPTVVIPGKPAVVQTAPALLSPTREPTQVAQKAPDNRCLVQVDGATYDVSGLRGTHPGGDIFACGTDMSQSFWGQHNQEIFAKLQKYRI